MVEKKELDNLIWQLLRGSSTGFRTCELIQEGVSYKKSIPKSFWLDEDKGAYGILGFEILPKAELRKVRDEVISRIIKEINEPSQPEMLPDHYSRLFHALELLKVDKRDPLIPKLGKDNKYNIAYLLWWLDNGDKASYGVLSRIAWYSAEAIKEGKFEK